ncbi:T9SS type A sorting domain-containing protein [Hymenobacter qilianensis]|uniref:T9SS type A sorting domain-containing protein n=1 Tax=Hymenobacter qilianensis TaxID=1385715 RepID=UPI00166C3CE5|nr:T9SS type A sorting domain-containing protein [Hymenobacter qilianensis]
MAKLSATRTGPVATWLQLIGGGGAVLNTLAVAAPHVYVGGACYGPLRFGRTQLADRPSLGGLNAFVAKLTDTGPSARREWAHAAGGALSALAVGQQGLFLAGSFRGVAGELSPEALPTSGNGNRYLYVAKLVDTGAAGLLSWVQPAAYAQSAWVSALAVRDSSVYIGGSFFDKTLRLGTSVLTNARHGGGTDIFVAKLTDTGAAGRFTWAQRLGGQGYDECQGLAVNETGLYLAGEFGHSLDAGPGRVASVGGQDLLVAQLRDAGPTATVAWAQSLGSPANDAAWAIALRGPRVYVAGHLVTPIRVGAGPLVEHSFVGLLRAPVPGPERAAGSPVALELYPNPARGSVRVALAALAGGTQATLTLVNARGQVVRRTTQTVSETGLDYAWSLAELSAGIYLLQVQAGATRLSRRLVVE